MIPVLTRLVVAVGTAAVDALVDLVQRKTRKRDTVPVQGPEPPHVTWKDVEHIREQERSSIARKG
jgi:hypothetical protein